MSNNVILFATRKGKTVTTLEKADTLIVYDMDTGEKTQKENPLHYGLSSLEELFEEIDPSIIIVSDMDEELEYLVEENGIKVIKIGEKELDELTRYLFGSNMVVK